MKVYRLEFPHGQGGYVGPYNVHHCYVARMTRELDSLLGKLHLYHSPYVSDRHPPIHVPDGHSVAVRSMQDLYRWFGGFLPKLLKEGARVGVYEVDEEYIVEEDEYQLAFIREFAKDVTPSPVEGDVLKTG